jgi:O-antigen ligase/polysaccharide polymerase Wzy-like membrane protein
MGGVGVAVFLLLQVVATYKVALYVDALDRSGLLYAVPVIAIAALLVILKYPRLSLHLLAFLLPFNFVGGYWGQEFVVLLAKVAVSVLTAAAVVTTFLAPARDRAWITRTRLGLATLAWLGFIAVGTLIGLFSAPDRGHWVRESGWMFFFASALPFGTLLRGRRDIERLVWTTCAGVAVLQAYAYWVLVTGRRFARADAWEGGQSFFRAPYSCESLFVLYLAAAALLLGAQTKLFNRRSLVLFATIALLGGGLLASMVRSLWLSGVVGMIVVLMLAPWNRRSAQAALVVVAGAVLAVPVVTAVDNLSSESSGNWAASAITFFLDLGSKESTSKVTRQMEWWNAIEVWKRSPVVGLGFGYPFPRIYYRTVAEASLTEPFYIHNSYLNVLAKTGALGLGAFLYLIWQALALALQMLRRRTADVHERVLATGLAAGILQVTSLSITTPVLTAGDTAAYFGLLVGLAAATRRAALREADRAA